MQSLSILYFITCVLNMETVCSSDVALAEYRISKPRGTEYGSILIFQGSVPCVSTGVFCFACIIVKRLSSRNNYHHRIEVAMSPRICYRKL